MSRVEERRIGEAELIAAGFRRHGEWTLTEEGIAIDVAPAKAAVYAFLLDGVVVYVGQTNHLRRRFGNYRRGDKSRRRVRELIQAALTERRAIIVLVAMPGATEWNGLPVDLVPGLEGGLLRAIAPAWNRVGLS